MKIELLFLLVFVLFLFFIFLIWFFKVEYNRYKPKFDEILIRHAGLIIICFFLLIYFLKELIAKIYFDMHISR